jgi:probable F420-dependent oxidoreductase
MTKRRYWGIVTPTLPRDLLVAQAQQQEAMGLEGLFAPQMYGPPFVPLATAAAVTTRVKLASGVALAFARSPFETAMAAMDLDRISGGRFILGLGASVRSFIEGFCGMPYDRPLDRLRENVAAIRQIIATSHTGNLKRIQGKYYDMDFHDFQPLAEPVRTDLPIWVAALRQPMVRLGAEIAEGVMGHPIWSIRWATSEAQDALNDGLRRAGKERSQVDLNAWFFVSIDDDRRQAVDDARPTVAFYAAVAQYEEYFAAHGFRAEAQKLQEGVQTADYLGVAHLVPDEMAETFAVCGTPDEVRRKLEPVWDVVDSMCLVPPAYGLPAEKVFQYATTIGQTFYA